MPLRRHSLPDCADAYSGHAAANQALSDRVPGTAASEQAKANGYRSTRLKLYLCEYGADEA